MTNRELLTRYHATRSALLADCTRETMDAHLATLDLILQRFPDIQYPHSQAEWYLDESR